MPISQEQKDTLLSTINEKLRPRGLVCPISGDQSWGVEAHLALVPVTDRTDVIQLGGGPSLPLAILTCRTCGYTIFINIIVLGLADLFGVNVSRPKDEADG